MADFALDEAVRINLDGTAEHGLGQIQLDLIAQVRACLLYTSRCV